MSKHTSHEDAGSSMASLFKDFKEIHTFVENVFEIAFGDDAINKDHSPEEVISRIKEFAEKSWMYEEACK